MFTVKEAINAFHEQKRDATVKDVRDYGDKYLFTAFITDNDMDPFYLVDKRSGNISHYTIAEDLPKYYSSSVIWSDKNRY